jgi:PadR family transcriptional regulator, regulatory protein PadR
LSPPDGKDEDETVQPLPETRVFFYENQKKWRPGMEWLTKLEELVLIAVLRLGKDAYGISVFNFIVGLTGKQVSISSVYFPLERLVRRGYLQALRGDPTPRRGGLAKRYYRLTRSGCRALQENRLLTESAWSGVRFSDDLSEV